MKKTPDIFLKYQNELMNSVSIFAVTVVEKSRRTGYSWAAAAIAVLTAIARKDAGGTDVFYMGFNLDMAREFIDYCAEWAKSFQGISVQVQEDIFNDPDKPDKDIKVFRIDFASGFKILALPSVPRALRGMQGLVILDEAAFHDDLSGVLKAALALLMWGGKVLIISTHNGESSAFNGLVQDIRAKRKPYHLLRCTLDDALTDGLYKRICLKKDEEWNQEKEAAWRKEVVSFYGDDADEELFCIPSKGSGLAISSALVEARMNADAPVLIYECSNDFVQKSDRWRERETEGWCEENLLPVLISLNQNERHCIGGDFARNVDLSYFWPLAVDATLKRKTPFTIELRNVPFRDQEQILFFIVDRLPRFFAGKLDARGNGQYLAERAQQRYGMNFEQVMLSEKWYLENMQPFIAAFEDANISIPKNDGILTDFQALRKVRGVIRVVERTGEKEKKRHGDSAIAGALAYAASRENFTEYAYQPVTIKPVNIGENQRPDHSGDFVGMRDDVFGGLI